MKTHTTQFVVAQEHIDGGGHFNTVIQIVCAYRLHDELRALLGLSLEFLRDTHDLMLIMSWIKDIRYRSQVYEGAHVDATISIWIESRIAFGFKCVYSHNGRIATEMCWLMPLSSITTKKIVRIPTWIIDIIGPEKPEVSPFK